MMRSEKIEAPILPDEDRRFFAPKTHAHMACRIA